MARITELLLLFLFTSSLQVGFGATNSQDAAALRSLLDDWQNAPPGWGQSSDPCGSQWEGVTCNNSRVTMLSLLSMGLKGTVSGDIGQLTQLQSLDLSFNKDLGGTLTGNIGNLKQLTTLILSGCSFSGRIPQELGNLPLLSFLALNSNQFSGPIPASLGGLQNLYWFDLGDNQLSGPLPVSTNTSPGLDLLVNTKHFHFNQNQLSGNMSQKLFNSNMTLIHILLDSNKLTGGIPSSLGLVQTLQALRLDGNSLTGPVPSSINNLINLYELNLANNQLNGAIPNLTGMSNLNSVDLSNNTFSPTEVPPWFSSIQSLTALVIQSGGIYGEIPQELFGFPQLQQVILDDNAINGSLDIGSSLSPQLRVVNFQNNDIAEVTVTSSFNGTLDLLGNPVCSARVSNAFYCLPQHALAPYSTNLNCGSSSCPSDQSLSPLNCYCAYPYEGLMIFRAPYFRDLTNATPFKLLETSLWTKINLTPGSVYLSNPYFDTQDYLRVDVKLFPSVGKYFNRSEVLRVGLFLSNQVFKAPSMFGTYYFIAFPYNFQGTGGGSSLSKGAVAGIVVASIVIIIGLVALMFYAFKQKKRAERAIKQSKPFATWTTGDKDTGAAPELKGAKWFSFSDLRKSTNNFSESNEIGSGGYGKVYKGLLSSGQMVAIKRAQQGSMQGGLEFKTEIELLSRVHHKNLVGLVGFCFEQGEQMLVYEYIPNGTLRENLIGRGGVHLDWKKRLRTALGSAKGLAYLHELADPPIIHRDIKSTNILLDENLNAKVADFGLSKLVSDIQKGHVSTQVKGTLGYLDPEYYMSQQLTDKSDVYSFGVVMLELISSRQPIEKGKYIVREVRLAMDANDEKYYGLKEIMDPQLRYAGTLVGFRRFVELAMQCVEEAAANRPSMNEVVKEIEVMLQSEGLHPNSNPTSASSSATDFGNTKGSAHPYTDQFPKKDESSDSFKYSGGFTVPQIVEPK